MSDPIRDDSMEPTPLERRLSDTSRAQAFIAGVRAGFAAFGRILIGVVLLVVSLVFLGVEMKIALDIKTPPHWSHLAFYIGLTIAAASILLPTWAKTFFGWLVDLVKGARGVKG